MVGGLCSDFQSLQCFSSVFLSFLLTPASEHKMARKQ